MSAVEQFFNYAKERELIRRKREAGEPWPWTDDPVLQAFRFCNIFREDDRVTRWFRENVREPLRNEPTKVVLATAGFRWFTRTDIGERIKWILLRYGWSTKLIKKELKGVYPLVTGAYMMTSPHGMNKLDGICHSMDLLRQARKDWGPFLVRLGSLQAAHEALMAVPYLGDFRAYEIVTDLRHTFVLEAADDIWQWANPGPGAIRGLNWIYGTQFTRKKEDLVTMQLKMQELLDLSRPDSFWWPEEWPQWEMRDVEHTLCEFDKYKRGQAGDRLKRRYTLGETSG